MTTETIREATSEQIDYIVGLLRRRGDCGSNGILRAGWGVGLPLAGVNQYHDDARVVFAHMTLAQADAMLVALGAGPALI